MADVIKNEAGDVLDQLDTLGLRCRKFITDSNDKIAEVARIVTEAKARIDRNGETFPGGFDHWVQVYVINPPWEVPKLLTHGGWGEAKKTGEVAPTEAIVAKVEATKAKTRDRSLARNKRAHANSKAVAAAQTPAPEPESGSVCFQARRDARAGEQAASARRIAETLPPAPEPQPAPGPVWGDDAPWLSDDADAAIAAEPVGEEPSEAAEVPAAVAAPERDPVRAVVALMAQLGVTIEQLDAYFAEPEPQAEPQAA